MRKTLNCAIALCVVMLASMAAMAQDEKNKVEAYLGYSFHSAQTDLENDFQDFDERLNSHGFEGAITGNFHKYVGAKFDFSTHSKSDGIAFGDEAFNVKLRTNQYLGGVQFKNNLKDCPTFKPFAHVLDGVANKRITASGVFEDFTGGGEGDIILVPFNERFTTNNFAMAIGAGLDVKVHRHVDIRLVQFDYNPIFFRDVEIDGVDIDIPGTTQHNYRVGFGVVIH